MSVSALSARLLPRPSPTVLPGFGLTMGLTLAWLSLIILIPLAGVFVWSAGLGWEEFSRLAFDPRTIAALKLSFGAAFIAAAVNVVFGFLVAYVPKLLQVWGLKRRLEMQGPVAVANTPPAPIRNAPPPPDPEPRANI